MRLAHVLSTPEGVGGAEHLVAALARRSVSQGHDVQVLNVFQNPHMGSALAGLCAPAPVAAFPGTGFRPARKWLQEQLRAFRPDVVHSHLARALVVTASLRRVPGTSIILTHHHGDLFVRQRRRLARAVERLAAPRFDAVVAVSPAVAAVLTQRLGYRPDRVHTIMNGWTGAPLPRSAAGDAPQIVCIARLRPEKGHAPLLTAMEAVLADVPTASLHLLGDGPERNRIRTQAAALGINGSVHLHGDVDDVWPFLADATLAVQPSLAEPFGISALEAMAAGVPLVASATGGLVDFVDHERTGLLVEPGKAEQLASAIVRLLTSADLAQALARRAQARAAGLRLEDTLDRYDELYASLVRR